MRMQVQGMQPKKQWSSSSSCFEYIKLLRKCWDRNGYCINIQAILAVRQDAGYYNCYSLWIARGQQQHPYFSPGSMQWISWLLYEHQSTLTALKSQNPRVLCKQTWLQTLKNTFEKCSNLGAMKWEKRSHENEFYVQYPLYKVYRLLSPKRERWALVAKLHFAHFILHAAER